MVTENGRTRTRFAWIAATLSVACVFVLAAIGSTFMLQKGGSGSRAVDGQAALEALDARLTAAEQRWNAGSNERALIAERITQLEKSANSNVRRARTEAGALIEGVKRETSRNFEGVQSRLSGMESIQLEMHAEVARLREELAAVRKDLDAIRRSPAEAPIP